MVSLACFFSLRSLMALRSSASFSALVASISCTFALKAVSLSVLKSNSLMRYCTGSWGEEM